MSEQMREERDSMGVMQVPTDAMYGAQTARAKINFPISGLRFPPVFIRALAQIKKAAASVNEELGLLDGARARLIRQSCDELIAGQWHEHFVLDIFQTGSGTSTNMNANEVIAHRCAQLDASLAVHPNDHVNRGQSSNDVIPTAMHLASAELLQRKLLPALVRLHRRLQEQARATQDVRKIGRTHLMDATPITLGQEISGWARQIELAMERLQGVMPRLCELAQGGTAVGTGLNTHREFGSRMARALARAYELPFTEARNHFAAQAAQDAVVELSGQLRGLAVALVKIANDVRLLNSGPRCGLGEIRVPAVQPGSSIMPGKVNPVIAESLAQVCAQVIGHDAAVAFAGASGLLELNVMLPLMIHNVLESETILAHACDMFDQRCIAGLQPCAERCEDQIEWSMSMVTALAPEIGYDRAAALAKQAVEEGKSVRQLCIEQNVLPRERLDALLDPAGMLHPFTSA